MGIWPVIQYPFNVQGHQVKIQIKKLLFIVLCAFLILFYESINTIQVHDC